MPTDTRDATTWGVAGHGAALAGPPPAGGGNSDEDALTLSVDAAWLALERAGRPAIGRVVVVMRRTVANDAAILLAATRLDDAVPVLRAENALDALELLGGATDATLLIEADDGRAAAIVTAADGYAELGPIVRSSGGAAIVDGSRDPRFARLAGGRALAKQLGVADPSAAPLLAIVAAIEGRSSRRVVAAGEGAVSGVDVAITGEVP
ncbi:MAG: hypothetical protein JWN46_821, partial [Acidimicrobiales bacterium]|nr:hypothetical protein [Acidimicrobiales bacterium]